MNINWMWKMADSESYDKSPHTCIRRYYSSTKSGDVARNKILKYLKKNNGAHISKARDDLKMANGVMQYHMQRLEREGKLKLVKELGRVYLFLADSVVEIPDVSKKVLEIIRKHFGKSQKELAELLRIPAPTFSAYADRLIEKGLVEKLKEGKYVTYSALDNLVA